MRKSGWLIAWVGFGVLIACGEQAVDYPEGSGDGTVGKPAGSACVKNSDCAGVCIDGKCAGCTSNAQCTDPAKAVCDTTTGACGGCKDSGQCPAGQACIQGQCSACTSNQQCPAGQACVNSACGPCQTNSQCSPGEQCVGGQCTSGSNDGGVGPTVDSSVDACLAGYVGFVGPVGAVWGNGTGDAVPGFGVAAGGKIGKAAGDNACNLAYAGSRACTWEEVKQSDVCGKLAALKNQSITAWMHRTAAETAMSDDNPGLPAGAAAKGARCNDWTYPTNHAFDGEFIQFGGGTMAGKFDSDTADDNGATSIHAVADKLQCAGETRHVLCCK